MSVVMVYKIVVRSRHGQSWRSSRPEVRGYGLVGESEKGRERVVDRLWGANEIAQD